MCRFFKIMGLLKRLHGEMLIVNFMPNNISGNNLESGRVAFKIPNFQNYFKSHGNARKFKLLIFQNFIGEFVGLNNYHVFSKIISSKTIIFCRFF